MSSMTTPREYRPQTAAETLGLIASGVDPWLAVGQLLDDWRAAPPERRPDLCDEPLPAVPAEYARWATFLAAAVEWLCAQDKLPFPRWTSRPEYRLAEPWFL